MTAPQQPQWTEPAGPLPEPGSYIPFPEPSPVFGPDHHAAESLSTEDVVRDHMGKVPPKQNQKNPPRSGKSVFSTLGQNKKPRSGIRALTEDDKEKIASFYTFGAMGLMPFRFKAAQAMALSADKCADAWFELAKKNDGVRRAILWMIEGGEWGKVFMAHTPILAAMIPENALPPMFRNFDMDAMLNQFNEEPND